MNDSELELLVCDAMALITNGDPIPASLARPLMSEMLRFRLRATYLQGLFDRHLGDLQKVMQSLDDNLKSAAGVLRNEKDTFVIAYAECHSGDCLDD